MIVTTVCGSVQPGSTNDVVLRFAERRLQERGAEVRRVDGWDALPPFRPDVDVPPAVAEWAARVAEGDAVLIATPEYAAGPPGALKNALDWLVGLSALYRRPVGLVCAGSTGGPFTIESLVRTLSYQGALVVGTLGVAAVATKLGEPGEGSVRDVRDEATREDLDRLADRLTDAVGADEPALFALVAPVVLPHGVDPHRFGLREGGPA